MTGEPTADSDDSLTDNLVHYPAVKRPEAYYDTVNHPRHYTSHPSGIECITVTEHMGFNLGNAVKYIWRADLKSDSPTEDLHKALWYINREIERRSRTNA